MNRYLLLTGAREMDPELGSTVGTLDRTTGVLALHDISVDGMREVARVQLDPDAVRGILDQADPNADELALHDRAWTDLLARAGVDAFTAPDPSTEDTPFESDEVWAPAVATPNPELLRDIAARRDGTGPRHRLDEPLWLAYSDPRWSSDPDADSVELQDVIDLEVTLTARVLADDRAAWDRFVGGYNLALRDRPPPPDAIRRIAAAPLDRRRHELCQVVPRAVRARLSRWLRTEPEAERYAELLATLRSLRERIILRNLHLAYFAARRVHHQGLGPADLLLHGVAGVARTLDSYDPAQPARFGTYARHWIMARVTRASSETGGPTRIPNTLVDQRIKAGRAIRQHALEGDEESPSPGATRPVTYTSEPEEVLALLEPDPHHGRQARLEQLWTILDAAVAELGPRERSVVDRRLGLSGQPRMTLAEIGETMNLSRERVRQIERSAFYTLWAIVSSQLPGSTNPTSSGSPMSSS